MAVLSTTCYIEKNGQYLMLHRTKKEQDMNHDKYLGIGGKFEAGESPEECIRRETLEETGLQLKDLRYRGIVTFVSDRYETEYMHMFTATEFEGDLIDCNEGDLVWIDRDKVCDLPIWEGDKLFFELLQEDLNFFSLKVHYDAEDKLIESQVYRY